MCNFIIRPIDCYATVDIGDSIKAGNKVKVQSVTVNGDVIVELPDGTTSDVIMSVFTHTFSDKDPNKKESKKDSKESK